MSFDNFSSVIVVIYRLALASNVSRRTDLNLPLTPLPSTNMQGRHTFQIHGDKRGVPIQSSSNGCIIFNLSPRKKYGILPNKIQISS